MKGKKGPKQRTDPRHIPQHHVRFLDYLGDVTLLDLLLRQQVVSPGPPRERQQGELPGTCCETQGAASTNTRHQRAGKSDPCQGSSTTTPVPEGKDNKDSLPPLLFKIL